MHLPQEIAFLSTKAPPVPSALRLKARECIATFVQLANERLGAQMPMPTCSFDLRGKIAGKAWSGRRGQGAVLHVQLNSVLFQENVQSFMQDTIPHEVAHLVTRKLHGRAVASHGPEWQRVMRALGVEPQRTHRYDVSNAAVASRLYRFSCACRTFELTPRKSRPALQGLRACRQCKGVLAYAGEARIDQQWRAYPLEALAQAEGLRLRPAHAESGRTSPERPTSRLSLKARAPQRPPPRAAPAPTRLPSAAPSQRKPPSQALLRYVEGLARRLRVAVPPQAREDQAQASIFVDRAKALLQQVSPPGPAPVVPTEKQLAFATSIASRRGLVVPADVLASRALLSRWIDEHLKG